ncbi:ATP-binding protein [Streptomyces carpinensis]|uniref:ATP-binding protein n=1 Tax=Streptomyces carpinensis TaxID=66369 RepID=A0ABV1W1Q7_9ACTN|nr:ATP-binding protein [Streptomyces carpinensis]
MLEPLRQGLPPLDPAAASDAASCALPARYDAVREARRFTRRTLDEWELSDRFDDVCLVVSELVTNALRHAVPAASATRVCEQQGPSGQGPSEPGSSRQGPVSPGSPGQGPSGRHPLDQAPPVRLHLMHWTERLVCAVRDPSQDSPVARATDDFSAESGRGLFLVDSFSDSWGWHPLAGGLGGKVVWALFRFRPSG